MKLSKKKMIFAVALVLILGAAAGIWYQHSHVFVNGDPYPKNSETLDLCGSEISIEYYEALSKALPECNILWDVPFQDSFYPDDTRELTVDNLGSEDIEIIRYFPALQKIDAVGCTDFALLMELIDTYPELEILYCVPIDGQEYPQDASEITITSLSDEEIALIQYLPMVKTVTAYGCDLNQLRKLQETYPEIQADYSVSIDSEQFSRDTTTLSLDNAALSELAIALWHLPKLEAATLTDPRGTANELVSLLESYPNVSFTWTKDVLGVSVSSTDTEVDLSGTAPDSLEQIEADMAWFPAVENVYMFDLPFDHAAMARFREIHRDAYKVIWNVDVGPYILRSDATTFMPVKHGRNIYSDEAYNLRYCEDMICIDLGHSDLQDCEWAQFMPHLKYLVLADTQIDDIRPLGVLKELVFLEIFMTNVTDYSPLIGCTGLDDLNLGHTVGSGEPLKQMTWLKRLWWANSPEDQDVYQDFLPNTQLMFQIHYATGTGWRNGDHYYEMRDALGVHYMPSEP